MIHIVWKLFIWHSHHYQLPQLPSRRAVSQALTFLLLFLLAWTAADNASAQTAIQGQVLKSPLTGEITKSRQKIPKGVKNIPAWEGFQAYRNKDYEEAIRLFFKAVEKEPRNPSLYYYLADCYVKTDRYGDAKYFYQKTISTDPFSSAGTLALMAIEKIDDFNRKYSTTIKLPNNNRRTPPPSDEEPTGAAGDTQGLVAPPSQKEQPAKPTTKSAEKEVVPPTTSGRITLNALPWQNTVPNEPDSMENYLDYVAEDGVFVRWPEEAMPLQVYIQKDGPGEQYYAIAKQAMDSWVQASGGKITYVEVSKPDKAQIRVLWSATLGFKDVGGQGFMKEGSTRIRQSGKELYQEIKVATLDFNRKPNPTQRIFHTLVHEFGHALGLRGHSRNPGDVMYATKTGEENGKLSQRDINTIRELYLMEISNE